MRRASARAVALREVSRDGLVLKDADEELKKDRDILLVVSVRFCLVYLAMTIPQNKIDTIPERPAASAAMYAATGTGTRRHASTMLYSLSFLNWAYR